MNVQLDPIIGMPISQNDITEAGVNPTVIIIITIVIILYYILFASLGGGAASPSTTTPGSGSSGGVEFFEILLWAVFILLITMNGMSYMFNIDVTAGIRNVFSKQPEVDILINRDNTSDSNIGDEPVPEIKIEKQVFHVPNNKYTYRDAKALCKAYGGRLAKYKEIEDAYKSGADWCGYGWSDGQMALYPTQYDKWEKLQSIDGHEHDCGRPGINGGYLDNKNIRFGANCYGYKPKITSEEADLMQNAELYQKTEKEINFDNQVKYWRDKLPDILVAPFNHDNWSII